MKLIQQRGGESFYESFSDLIFGTLVVFIVMVMALALRLQASSESAKVVSEQLVAANRFTGGTDQTYLYVTAVPIDGKTHLVWLPHQFADDWGVVSYPEEEVKIDPILDICRWAKGDGISVVDKDDLKALAPGLSHALCVGNLVPDPYTPGESMYMIREAQRLWPDRYAAWSAEDLKTALGDLKSDPNWSFSRPVPSDPALLRARDAYLSWSTYENKRAVFSRISEVKTDELLMHTKASASEPPRLTLTVGEAEGIVRVGKLDMTAADARNLLRSLKPGKGFYVTVEDELGEPLSPPQWLLDGVLVPTGFGGRVLKEEVR